MKQISKLAGIIGLLLLCVVMLGGCEAEDYIETDPKPADTEVTSDVVTESMKDAQWETAMSTPLGRYPELVTYTLGKMTSENNSNMPSADTYENNNYTRYLRELLNVQNDNAFEGMGSVQYEQLELMAIQEGNLPDIMLVTSKDILDLLVEQDLIEDLTPVYESCTSNRIKEMYDSYGEDKLGMVTYDGKLMAFPETEVYTGPSLLWMRKDWIDQLGLKEPKTMEEAMEIIKIFVRENPGKNQEGNVGLAFAPSLVGQSDICFSLDPLFDHFHAYPGKWLEDENGNMVNGSVTKEMKTALAYLHEQYAAGVLDQSFMLRNKTNLSDLLSDGRCGAFFGWWWAPDSPLSGLNDASARWKPYLFPDENGEVYTSLSYGRQYCVVARKGYEHPEIIPKIISALFDYARYDGKEEAVGVGQYLGMNVDQPATPFLINTDYSDAVFRTTRRILSVMNNRKRYSDLTVLEQGYYDSCQEYLKQGQPRTGFLWAAYTSRITAVSKLINADIRYVNEGCTQEYNRLTDDKLEELALKTFIQIIIGEQPVDAFDAYVQQWYEMGGRELTEQANLIKAGGSGTQEIEK